jgi:TPR repeat protein
MYANGRGVLRDRDAALKWFTESALAGSIEAQHMLGGMYARGKGVRQDLGKAAEWFRMAAEHGDDAAQLILGLMLRDGRGVPKDDIAAYLWISESIARRDGERREIARRALDTVARRLAPEQLREAQQRAHARQAQRVTGAVPVMHGGQAAAHPQP